ncbi:cytochrome c [Variovorax sp. J22G73]|uniref:c-type cytochrome n=1 Tax=unclassified Variovorax TaxID=663243 RepID=UPI002575D74D|nr:MULTISPECIES: cytochrome c [unclassified Variovorax]MDM0008349.1 cytochrome c [Variovorax sp. J22R203]MDM0100856.1 cytochrome c [Variovorax sp. J22G73]
MSARRVYGGVAVAVVLLGAGAWAVAQKSGEQSEAPAAAASASMAAPASAPVAMAAAAPAPAASADPVLEHGRYLARAGDCVSCHTAPGKPAFGGGLPMKTPFGTIVSTNISPDPQAGIGAYTEAEFARALREGIARDGHRLYPAMPYPSFARVNDEDMHALFTFFRNGVQPVAQKPPATDLPWPFSMRSLMIGWNWIYLDKGVYQGDAARSAEWNRGAYLVQGLGHCGDCHTPRSMLGGVKAASERKGEVYLSGAVIDGWYAQPLRHTDRPTMAQWSSEDIVQYLQSGRTSHTAAFGAMVDVVQNSTQHLSTQDLQAVAVYLQSLGAKDGAQASSTSTPQATQASLLAAAPQHPSALALRNGTVEGNSGAMVYLNNCNACHRSDGTGADKTFPALAGNSVVNAKDPTSLIRLVLAGSAMPSTAKAPSPIAMPDFGWRLTDADVASVLSFARSSWGNQGDAVTPAQVAKVRDTLKPVAKNP